MNSELMHRNHKYISRKWKNGRWVYEYEMPKKKVPNEYKPELKKTMYGNSVGYVNKDGLFFRGDYETARNKSYEYDLKKAEAKAQSQLREQNYRKSAKRHVDDTVRDISNGVKKVSSFSKSTIDKGRKKVASFLRSFANKIG